MLQSSVLGEWGSEPVLNKRTLLWFPCQILVGKAGTLAHVLECLFAATVDVEVFIICASRAGSSGALDIRIKTLFSRRMGVNFPII